MGAPPATVASTPMRLRSRRFAAKTARTPGVEQRNAPVFAGLPPEMNSVRNNIALKTQPYVTARAGMRGVVNESLKNYGPRRLSRPGISSSGPSGSMASLMSNAASARASQRSLPMVFANTA